MIRVHPPATEPEALRDARQWRAARVIRRRQLDPDDALAGQKVGYNVEGWREALLHAQHHKCAVCERADAALTSPIDHIRPWKLYPWLCWSASNHVVLCSDCNLAKDDAFPVSGARLPLGAWDSAAERPELVDPTRECPAAHVEYVLDDERGGEPAWVARGRTARGVETVEAYKLVRYGLDAWRRHVRRLEALAADLEERRPEDLPRAWARQVFRQIESPDAPYRALSLAWFEARFDASWRAARGLTLPSLADPSPAAAERPLFSAEPALDALPEDVALCVREARGAQDDGARREAARGLHALGQAEGEIAALLRVSVVSVRRYLR